MASMLDLTKNRFSSLYINAEKWARYKVIFKAGDIPSLTYEKYFQPYYDLDLWAEKDIKRFKKHMEDAIKYAETRVEFYKKAGNKKLTDFYKKDINNIKTLIDSVRIKQIQ